jgi:hypothetical protein
MEESEEADLSGAAPSSRNCLRSQLDGGAALSWLLPFAADPLPIHDCTEAASSTC